VPVKFLIYGGTFLGHGENGAFLKWGGKFNKKKEGKITGVDRRKIDYYRGSKTRG